MMKKFTLKTLLVMLVTCSAILLKPQSSLAQVNTSLLTEVVKSCQQDALSPEYYERMRISWYRWFLGGYNANNHSIEDCIKVRYFHSLVLSKLPSLTSASEMLPEYPGSVAVSLLAFGHRDTSLTNLVDCIASQDSSSQECVNASSVVDRLSPNYEYEPKIRNSEREPERFIPYIYICPACVVAHDDVASKKGMLNAFMKWFFGLNKLQRREVMSILSDGQDQGAIRRSIISEAGRAEWEYREVRQRIEQQEQDQRRREVLGE